jgi:hypothetical protein
LCIGGPLATAIIRITLHRILSRFRLTVVPGAEIGVHVESTMLAPTDGVPMQIEAADGKFVSSPIGGNIHELVEFDEAPAFAAGEDEVSRDEATPFVPRVPR